MEKNRRPMTSEELYQLKYGENPPGCLSAIFSALKALFAPGKMTIGDGRNMNFLHEKTKGKLTRPLKGEDFREKRK